MPEPGEEAESEVVPERDEGEDEADVEVEMGGAAEEDVDVSKRGSKIRLRASVVETGWDGTNGTIQRL